MVLGSAPTKLSAGLLQCGLRPCCQPHVDGDSCGHRRPEGAAMARTVQLVLEYNTSDISSVSQGLVLSVVIVCMLCFMTASLQKVMDVCHWWCCNRLDFLGSSM